MVQETSINPTSQLGCSLYYVGYGDDPCSLLCCNQCWVGQERRSNPAPHSRYLHNTETRKRDGFDKTPWYAVPNRDLEKVQSYIENTQSTVLPNPEVKSKLCILETYTLRRFLYLFC